MKVLLALLVVGSLVPTVAFASHRQYVHVYGADTKVHYDPQRIVNRDFQLGGEHAD